MIRDAAPMKDGDRLAEIYNHYVLEDTATFEVEPLGGANMALRIAAIQDAELPWIVATDALGVVGYAYAAPFHERAAYAHTVTASVYLDRAERGRGVGTALYSELLRRIEAVDAGPHSPIRSVVSLIALPNEPSVALHESLGFVKVAHLEHVGRKFNRWLDVGYWQISYGDERH